MHDLIIERIKNFWGYGSFSAPVWFVGMEEGLNPDIDVQELNLRFQLGHGESMLDMRHDMSTLTGHMKWFTPGAPIQSTWKYPIQLYLYFKNNRIPDKENVRDHQVYVLGDSRRPETATVELMPLPSRNTRESSWLYADYGVFRCESRKAYIEHYKPDRIKKLVELVRVHRPKLVIFYSVLYLPEWRKVIGRDPELITTQMYFVQENGTSFCVIPQAQSFGMSYDRLYEYAEMIKDRITL